MLTALKNQIIKSEDIKKSLWFKIYEKNTLAKLARQAQNIDETKQPY